MYIAYIHVNAAVMTYAMNVGGNQQNVKVVKRVSVYIAYIHVNAVIRPAVKGVNHLFNAMGKTAAKNTVRNALMERITT